MKLIKCKDGVHSMIKDARGMMLWFGIQSKGRSALVAIKQSEQERIARVMASRQAREEAAKRAADEAARALTHVPSFPRRPMFRRQHVGMVQV